ncbi:mechanosensitive ion channel family protein [Desulfofustis glycolicus]|uniref:Mechanosensing system component YbdG n=1 Tax=Desulfofustis glycolicus DSM 9705 TaxID=1121409 RepID=A0A1M5XWC9_9BACT|nr:mechanosensitive ion channel domain-containing protein [Desulfofustis glycolicus]SHI04056.1 miniconductance mechanosensitive channel [Desulfofustis glycolicus DSM 9705]
MSDNWFYQQLLAFGLEATLAESAALIISVSLILLIIMIATIVLRRVLRAISMGWIRRNRHRWDDVLVNHRVIDTVSWFVPLLLMNLSIDALLPEGSAIYLILKRTTLVFFVLVGVLSINTVLSAAGDIARLVKMKRADVLNGFVDAAKIASYIFGAIFVISIFSGMSPWGIISVLGGMTAVTMLVFRDTIVGFVASVQLTATDMVRIGDWVEMPSYGADGDVIGISIHTIRVQNWDKTITTIPTYALVSNSFKNWRGMAESGGRRIKRALMIDINSIRFCDHDLLERFSKIHLLKDYLSAKAKDIEEFNRQHSFPDDPALPINGRRQTNIGVFRAYVIAYLKSLPQVNQEMTFLVRHLAPTEHGLPLEIYVFSKDKRWAHYEAIQADIFDHLLAALPQFDLLVFQNPSGHDMRHWGRPAALSAVQTDQHAS